MWHEFETTAEALAAGYENGGKRHLETYRNYEIQVVDTSGYNSFGYDFGVKALPDDSLINSGHRTVGPFGSTVTVWTQELNQMKQAGSFRPMFAPNTLTKAIAEAKQAVDKVYATQ